MKRVAWLAFLCSASLAQTPDLTALEQTAQKRHAIGKLRRRVWKNDYANSSVRCPFSAAIAEVRGLSRAAGSRGRLHACPRQSIRRDGGSQNLLSAEERRAMKQPRAGGCRPGADGCRYPVRRIDAEHQPALLAARCAETSGADRGLIRQRSAESERQADAVEKMIPMLRTWRSSRLATQRCKRIGGLRGRANSWSGYYSARQARAQTGVHSQIGRLAKSGPQPAKSPAREGEAMKLSRCGSPDLDCGAAGLMGQTSREAYRQDYDAWREVQI